VDRVNNATERIRTIRCGPVIGEWKFGVTPGGGASPGTSFRSIDIVKTHMKAQKQNFGF